MCTGLQNGITTAVPRHLYNSPLIARHVLMWAHLFESLSSLRKYSVVCHQPCGVIEPSQFYTTVDTCPLTRNKKLKSAHLSSLWRRLQ